MASYRFSLSAHGARDGLAPSRGQALATVTVVVALIATAVLGSGLEARTVSVLDENWRGAYDVLVTQAGEDFGGGGTGGLVDGNFVSTAGADGITLEQLDAIRGLDGVEVAAPIGMVGLQRGLSLTPQLYIPDDIEGGITGLGRDPELVRITSELIRETGSGEELAWRSVGAVATAQQAVSADGSGVDVTIDPGSGGARFGWPGAFSPMVTNQSQQIQLGSLPEFGSTIIAVDPIAEQALLGEAGGFLEPLVGLPAERQAGQLGSGWVERHVDRDRYTIQWFDVHSATNDPQLQRRPVVPMVVNEAVAAQTRLEVRLERADEPPTTIPDSPEAVRDLVEAASFDDWETVTRDVADVAVPFSTPDLVLVWPGSQLPDGESGGSFSLPASTLTPQLIGRPSYEPVSAERDPGEAPSFRVEPREIVGPDGQEPPPPSAGPFVSDDGYDEWGTDLGVGLQRAYRQLVEVDAPGFKAALPAPVGEFDSDSLDLGMDEVSYVPFGSYDPAITTLLDVPGQPRLVPDLTGLDFVTGPPGAITDLEGAATLRGSPPIDAVRVRVAGIDSYTPDARMRVAEVAEGVTALGLAATVVAGSSLQPVTIFVPDRDDEGTDLGWVEQEWTTLGAAAVVESTLTDLQRLLVLIALVSAAAGLLSSSVLAGRQRHLTVALLRTVGWTERELRRRLLIHQLPLLLAVAAGVAIAAAISPGRGLMVATAAAGTLAVLLSVAAATWSSLSVQRSASPRRRPGSGFASVGRLAVRLTVAQPVALGCKLAGLIVLAACVLAAGSSVLAAREAVGETRLAGLALDRTTVATLTLALAGTSAAAVLLMLGFQADRGRQRHDLATMRRLGFTEPTLARLALGQALGIAVLGLALSSAAVVLLPALELTPGLLAGAGAAVIGAVVAGSLTTRRERDAL